MTEKLEIPTRWRELYAAIESFAHHSSDVCDCDLEGGDLDCKIEPKRPTPYEWGKMSSPPRIRVLIEELARLEQDLSAAKAELQARWEHSDHWRNPETGQVECECCCKWALDCAEMNKSVGRLTAQVDALKAPFTYSECEQSHVIADFVFKDGIDELVNCVDNANRYLSRRLKITAELAARLAAAQGAKEESRADTKI